ncbi:MAG: hypothetical protein KUG69_10650 [Marinosulfonomonas sp.]|nr:hypothetical protein [Marinosulfonomonas sp.]
MKIGLGFLAALLVFAVYACGTTSRTDAKSQPHDTIEPLKPLTGDEIRYLAFQVFEGAPNPEIPFDNALAYTPKAAIAKMVHDIVTTIGETGGPKTRLAFMLGPIGFDHTDAQARQIIDDGFAIALAENIAVGFHLDDAMFWSKRSDLIANPQNVEWTDFDGTPATGLKLDWAHTPPRMVFNAPEIHAEVTRRARDVIGSHIAAHVENLRSLGKVDLFAGVIAGWETHMGQDTGADDRVGFHALANRGFGPGKPPADVIGEIASIVNEFINLWTDGLAAGGLDGAHIYTHVAFLPRARFNEMHTPPGLTYETVLDVAPSSQRPATAFTTIGRPGFSTYPVAGVFDQIQRELERHNTPWWASVEGTNIIPGNPPGSSGMTMENYLAKSFNNGAALVTLFGWGIGGDFMPDNPFRTTTQGAKALATYRAFLKQ